MASERLTYEPWIKGLIIGDGGVGKSALLSSEVDDSFYSPWRRGEIIYKTKRYSIDVHGQTRVIKGEWVVIPHNKRDDFELNQTALGRGVIFLVFDLTDEQSFQYIRNRIRHIRDSDAEVPLVLIGNKCDQRDKRLVTTQRGQNLADQYGIPYFETSAKMNINVSQAFRRGLQLAINKLFPRPEEQPAQPPQRVADPSESQGFSRWQWGLMIVTFFPILFYGAYKLGQWLYNKGQALWAARNANAVAAAVAQPPAATPQPPNIHHGLAQLYRASREETKEEKRQRVAAEAATAAEQKRATAAQLRAAELERRLQTAEQKLQEAKQAPQRHEIINRHTRRQLAMDLLPEAKMASEVAHSAIYSKIGANAHSIPNDYLCPISAEIMTDPVIVNSHTYERSALLEWLTTHDTDPLDPSYKLTGPDLSVIQRNISLQGLIEKWVTDNTVVAAPAPVSLRR